MSVNRAGFGIVNDEVVKEAARQEIIRRYLRYRCEYGLGFVDKETVERAERIMRELDLSPEQRKVVLPAREAALSAHNNHNGTGGAFCGAALELKDGTLITGKNSLLMHAASSLILNAIKTIAGIPDAIHLLSPNIIESIRDLKSNVLNKKSVNLNVDETLMVLSMSATTNPTAKLCMEKLKELRGCEAHITHILFSGDDAGLRALGINLTSDPSFASKDLFMV